MGRWSWHLPFLSMGCLNIPRVIENEDVLSRCSAKLSIASIYEAVRASLFIYEYSDPLMKDFVECWNPSTNTLVLPHSEERIPESCLFLLHAYHSLASSSSDRSFSPVEWISFWSVLPQGYTGTSTVKSDRDGSSSVSYCPRGSIPAHRVFKHLGIPSSLEDEVYFAAFGFVPESIRSAPLGPGKGMSAPRLPSYMVPSSSKPLKKCSLPEEDSVDRYPKYAKWGSTRGPGHVIVSSPDAPITVTNDVEATPILLSEILPSSRDEAQTEVVDTEEFSYCMIKEAADIEASGDEAQTEIVDIEEPLDCMTTEVANIEVPVASLPIGVQLIKSILRDSLTVAWVELCSFVEGKSHEALLVEKEGIMACFEALTRFRSQVEELKAVFSKALYIRDAPCNIVLPKAYDRLAAVRTDSAESSSKLQHETKALDSVRNTLQQSEERAACLRQELTELDTHVEVATSGDRSGVCDHQFGG
ncbi:hypothetical protein LIER_21161 [Lithospermum erythrorhizon]|uniref:Aminotransferase-like plant mobile domain-containing protein n=1 Tax=Lithospermum erythrorhizon TaxID=34254 RepID=A0AAV3QRN4_LITER